MPGDPPVGRAVSSRGGAGALWLLPLPELHALARSRPANAIAEKLPLMARVIARRLVRSFSRPRYDSAFAWKEVTVAVLALARKRMPVRPEVRLVSLAVSIQMPGSVPEVGQMFTLRVDPTARKWIV